VALPQTRIAVIVPVRNAMRFLPVTVPSLRKAAARVEGVSLFYVDNGSTDGSLEFLRSIESLNVLERKNASIGAARNYAAALTKGDYLSFIDADCAIGENYFADALETISASGAAATGCEVSIPPNPHWIEATWHACHYVGHNRIVDYINSANFFIARHAFEDVGGFREGLRTGEDSELGQRLVRAGYRILECPQVEAIHLGNPKSTGDFYRRSVWHGLGMLGTVHIGGIDKPTAMMTIHLAATLVGLAILFAGSFGWIAKLSLILVLQLFAPITTVAYRIRQTRRGVGAWRGIILYWFYYWARLQACALLLTGRGRTYQK
jgi:glycosyltransferase involved in cell wall biosynthesis